MGSSKGVMDAPKTYVAKPRALDARQFNCRCSSQSGISEERIIYIDLDARKYRKIKTDDQFEALVDTLSDSKEMKYLFVDEIQNIENFEEIINAFRNDGDYSIFITGSNSYLLRFIARI